MIIDLYTMPFGVSHLPLLYEETRRVKWQPCFSQHYATIQWLISRLVYRDLLYPRSSCFTSIMLFDISQIFRADILYMDVYSYP